MDLYQMFFYAKATGRLSIMEQELLTLSETLEFTPFYYRVSVAESLIFCVVFFQDWWQNLNKKYRFYGLLIIFKKFFFVC